MNSKKQKLLKNVKAVSELLMRREYDGIIEAMRTGGVDELVTEKVISHYTSACWGLGNQIAMLSINLDKARLKGLEELEIWEAYFDAVPYPDEFRRG